MMSDLAVLGADLMSLSVTTAVQVAQETMASREKALISRERHGRPEGRGGQQPPRLAADVWPGPVDLDPDHAPAVPLHGRAVVIPVRVLARD